MLSDGLARPIQMSHHEAALEPQLTRRFAQRGLKKRLVSEGESTAEGKGQQRLVLGWHPKVEISPASQSINQLALGWSPSLATQSINQLALGWSPSLATRADGHDMAAVYHPGPSQADGLVG